MEVERNQGVLNLELELLSAWQCLWRGIRGREQRQEYYFTRKPSPWKNEAKVMELSVVIKIF